MAQATSKKSSPFSIGAHLQRSLREGALYLSLAVAVYLLLALLSYSPQDPGWSLVGDVGRIRNAGGRAGAWLADVLLSLFGYLAYLFPLGIAYLGVLFYRKKVRLDVLHATLRGMGLMLVLGAGAGLASLHMIAFSSLPLDGGGILGHLVSQSLVEVLSLAGASLFLWALFFTGFTLLTGLSWLHLVDALGFWTLRAYGWARAGVGRWRTRSPVPDVEPPPPRRPEPKFEPPPVKRPEVKHPKPPPKRAKAKGNSPSPAGDGWHMPLDLLDAPDSGQGGFSTHTLEEMAEQVELRLKDFGIRVKVVAVQPGPVITRFELEPAPGLKASRITNLSRDLARALAVRSVRVVEVIPGKSVIGLEIPNEQREVVRLSEILHAEAYTRMRSPLTLALGKDVEGKPVVANLARMPHLLVAGTTGSGKSVAINAMLLSLLHNAPPEEVRLILVDPKMLELSFYEGIPHLLAPVVTDMKEAANALRWCVAEMDRRYRIMAAAGVRNLAGFNRKLKEEGIPEGEAPLPYIVVVVDELADMMMVVGKKVEELIARLAQKARAAGIHLILATQRPSVDVITGLIKANIPARIAFQVSSRIDSRTILDQMGAEQLLGQGDMLYLPPGSGFPIRVHGAFVADQEVSRWVEHLKGLGEPDYHEEVLAGSEEEGASGVDISDAEADPLYDQAVRIVTETRRASVSGVQRRLKIGYNRAARLIEAMEQAGIVGPLQSNGSREVLAPPPVAS